MRDHAHHVELVVTTRLVVGPDEDPDIVAANAFSDVDGMFPGHVRMLWACYEEGAGGMWESYPCQHDHEDDA